ncbi:hypothetical protein C4D60_Mb08t20570 [Musa balbisiana]|uniref:Protein SCAR n=1 Tax=Musa balbisiana TaxID=52838 RepID=A0A4S8K598_MUSBA|nr:hypothetical protein C4D60_Mb08t20570 [Musa balbisiana]
MPLVRLEVRNEYGLGDPELYRAAVRKEDPKAILDGVAVAGLVGILRQLGDLAEFAADVFHDLHEQITATAGRGRKLMTRVRNIQSALPSVEKAFKEQTSHIHFAYVAGSDWHARIRVEQSLLLSSELPGFMMDSYEECRDPPRLFLLDKFDHAGTGACLKRYSDPSYFKRTWAASQMQRSETVRKEKKFHTIKRKGSRLRNGKVQHSVYMSQRDCRTTNSDGCTRFTSPSIDGQSLSAENISIADTKLNPEFSSRSTSFGSKTKESYVEQTSYVNPPVVPDELDYNEVPIPNLHSKDGSLCVSVLHDEPTADCLDDVSQHDSLQEQSIPRSSSVTWDEKIEIFKPTSPVSYDDILVDRVQDSEDIVRVEDLEPLQVNSIPENTEHAEIESLNQEDILFHPSKSPVALSDVNHFDEVTSETDNYVDAPNTLDSETETETECHTKREVESLSNFSSQGMESRTEMNRVIAVQNPDFSDVEAPDSSHSSLNQDVTPNFLHLSSSDGSELVQSPYDTEFVQNQEHSVVNDFCESNALDTSETKDHECECIDSSHSPKSGTSSSPTMMLAETTAEKSILRCSTFTDVSNAPSIQLWTNGGLFGVEPSKPPELGVLNTQSKNSMSNSRNFASELDAKSDAEVMQNEPSSVDLSSEMKVDGEHYNLHSSIQGSSADDQCSARGYSAVQKSKGSPSFHHSKYDSGVKQDSHISAETTSQQEFEHNPESTCISSGARSSELYMTRNSATREAPLRANYSTGSRQDGPSQSSMGVSSSFSELAQRFLANTIQRKALLSTPLGNTSTEIRKPDGTSCLNDGKEASNGVVSQASHEQSTNEKVASISAKEPVSLTSRYSEQSSPPLEYMRISFHPMNGLENPKLKLEFSNGSLHDNSEDFVFPSFQLLQGPVDSLPDACSDSDDDTFCRSCPYSSEDLLSPRSYSISEQWEQDERSEYIDHELNGVLDKFQSSVISISRSVEFEQLNDSNMNKPGGLEKFDTIVDNSKVPFHSGSTMELPGLDSVLSLRNQQERICYSTPENLAKVEVQSKDEMPPPPPLPPVQWRTSKSSVTDVTDASTARNFNNLDGLQALRCAPSEKKEQHVPISPFIIGATSPHCNEKQDQQKLNGPKRATHCVSHKEVDTREDLLHQIRNKSFNLRRTAKSTPSDIPRPTTDATSGNVAAILKKASAIRQAFVSSDEGGDDDSWSDA